MLLALVTGFYFYVIGNRISPQVIPNIITENPPVVEEPIPSKAKEEKTLTKEKQPVISPSSSSNEKIELTPSPSSTHEDAVNLEDQSYSIHKEKKEINITPGVVLQPGKSVNLKVGEDIIRVGRDKIYHPGGYNVLWEKKY